MNLAAIIVVYFWKREEINIMVNRIKLDRAEARLKASLLRTQNLLDAAQNDRGQPRIVKQPTLAKQHTINQVDEATSVETL